MEHTEEEELVDFASSVTNKGLPSPPSSPPLPNLIDHLPTTETLDEKFQNLGLEEKEKPVEEVELGDHDRKGQDEEEKKEPVEEEEGDHNRKEGDVIVNGRKEDENSVENLDLNEFSKDVLEEDDKEKDNLDVNGQSKENPEEEEKVYPEGDENYNGKEKENPQGDENWNGNEKENHEQENWNVSEKENPWNENDNPVEHENWNHNDYPQGGENWNPNDYPQGGENWNQNDYLEGGETVGTEQKNGRFQYPLRPGEPDCTYYLRTGTCRYGLNCRFNHPTRRKRQARSPSKRSPSMRSPSNSEEPFQTFKDNEEYSERNGQQECKYYLRTGGCKFGKACRYDHSRDKTANEPAAEFNFLGLPIRPGEKECPFYMRTGSCKFAINCRFHHPDPTAAGGSDSGYNKNGSLPLHSSGESQPAGSSWSAPRPSNAAVPYLDTSSSYVPMMLTPPQGLHSTLEWNGYQASPVMPLYPPKGNVRPPMAAPPMPPVLNDPTKNSDGFGHHQGMPVDEFPERPGQKECQYFMKTGDCKYKSACRFHHPKNRVPKTNALSPMGLPLRPDQIICTHYSRYGICKFGPACKYDHPANIGSPTFPGGGPMAPMPFDNSANFGGSVQQSV